MDFNKLNYDELLEVAGKTKNFYKELLLEIEKRKKTEPICVPRCI